MDTNGDLSDSTGDTCSWYMTNQSACGIYDYGDFSANDMCCACGGGDNQEVVDGAAEEIVDVIEDIIDVTGDDGDSIGEEIAERYDWEPCNDDPNWCAVLDI